MSLEKTTKANKEHIKILQQNGISISMDAKGRSIDNIAIERFWRSLKYEDVYPSSYKTLGGSKSRYKRIYTNLQSREIALCT